MTWHLQAVLDVFLSRPGEEQYGLEIATEAGILGGTLYPLLARLEHIGWLESRWEDLDEPVERHRRRRYYQLTEDGEIAARAALSRRTVQVKKLLPGWVG